MLKIGNRTLIQSATVQGTEQTEVQHSASFQPQTAEATKAVSSENTWQRAGLQQNELMQKSVLNNQLPAQQESYRQKREQVEKNKEARDENSSNSLFGTVLSPLIGTFVGGQIPDIPDDKNKNNVVRSIFESQSEEIKKLQAQLAEVYDSNFVATANGFTGRDERVEFQGESNVNQTTARKLTAKTSFSSDDDD